MAINWPFKRYLFFVESGQHRIRDIPKITLDSPRVPVIVMWLREGELTMPINGSVLNW